MCLVVGLNPAAKIACDTRVVTPRSGRPCVADCSHQRRCEVWRGAGLGKAPQRLHKRPGLGRPAARAAQHLCLNLGLRGLHLPLCCSKFPSPQTRGCCRAALVDVREGPPACQDRCACMPWAPRPQHGVLMVCGSGDGAPSTPQRPGTWPTGPQPEDHDHSWGTPRGGGSA